MDDERGTVNWIGLYWGWKLLQKYQAFSKQTNSWLGYEHEFFPDIGQRPDFSLKILLLIFVVFLIRKFI